MFDKLRKRFIIINMSLLTTVFVGIFGAIYFISTISINKQVEMTLQRVVNEPFHIRPGDPMSSGAIVIDTDELGEFKNYFTFLKVESNEIKEILQKIIAKNKLTGSVKIDGTTFEFLKVSTESGNRIGLIDNSNQLSMSFSLLRIFLIVGGISLVVLYIISLYLTNKTIKPIKESFEKQKQFIADASHELKTPLTIINTNASLIMSDPNDIVANNSKWIKYITLQTERMTELINEMLSQAKLDIDKNKVLLTEMSISKVVEHMVLSFEAIIFEGGFQLVENIKDNLIIKGNEQNIKKLFSILMDNAIKHTNKDGKISVELYTDKNKVKLKVSNTGTGIEENELNKIFERFYRVDSSRNRETGGYGLGLSIAKSIVEQHKGEIYAKSKVGEWTTFVVEIPV